MEHTTPITGTASAVLELLGVAAPSEYAPATAAVLQAAGNAFAAEKCDRVFLYNPDAIAAWLWQKYPAIFVPLQSYGGITIPMYSVFPSVTPACFGSMYSGVLPAVHGIQKYEKPVLKVSRIFDILPAAGKRTAIVSTKGDSISLIFLERNVDYYIYDTVGECTEKAMELIEKDEYSCIVLYHGNYDSAMHRCSPEGKKAMAALKANIETYTALRSAIRSRWSGHRTALAFAPDHGCHRVYGFFGNHGSDRPCDMEIFHYWEFL